MDGRWVTSRFRSRHPIIIFLKDNLPPADTIFNQQGDDTYLWAIGDRTPSSTFSTKDTWNHLNNHGAPVNWHKAIWFSGSIPKHAFNAWVTTRNRLHTRDRLLNWGMVVPSSCLLCNTADETRQHLFFDCSYSNQVWSFFTSRAHLIAPVLYDDLVVWLINPSPNKNLVLIMKLLFQASLYVIWKERNTRYHASTSRPASALILDIQNTIRCRLDPLSRAQRSGPNIISYLSSWFHYFQS